MNLYSVLLVDDEEDVVRTIMVKTDWESLGYRVIGYAHNGVEALEIAEEYQPDVVMTDIKMPYMDGLTLGRKLKEMYPSVKIILFSGFDDFEYAKEAIKLEVEEYLLKPVDPSEISEIFRRIRDTLDKQRNERQNMDKLKEYYLQSLPVLQDNFFVSLIEGRVAPEKLPQFLSAYQIDMKGPYYVVTVLHISAADPKGDVNMVLQTVSVKKLLEEQIPPRYRSKSINYLSDILLIAQLETEDEITAFTDTMDSFCRLARKVCDARVTAGIGSVCDKIIDLPLSYHGASSAVSYRTLYGNTRAINIVEIDPQSSQEEGWNARAVDAILRQTRLGDAEGVRKEIDAFVEQLPDGAATIQKYHLFLMELIAELLRFCNNNQLNVKQVIGTDNEIYEMIFRGESPVELGEWLKQVCVRMQDAILQKRENNTSSFVSKAIDYVAEHYADTNISIETVCRELGVSAAYFSTVFKKETGKTFISYLTDYRMEKAVELIMTTSDRTYMIAEKVGYADSNYFSYVFKKQYGLSPSKYRTEKLKANGAQ